MSTNSIISKNLTRRVVKLPKSVFFFPFITDSSTSNLTDIVIQCLQCHVLLVNDVNSSRVILLLCQHTLSNLKYE